MYIYLLNVTVYSNKDDSFTKYINECKSKLFTNVRCINDVKRYALNYIKDIINCIEYTDIEGWFSIDTYKVENGANNIFDKLLSKSDHYTQYFTLDGEETNGIFIDQWDNIIIQDVMSTMFNPHFESEFKKGDIIYYSNDPACCGIYVIRSTPKPIITDEFKDIRVYYGLSGIRDDGQYQYIDGIFETGYGFKKLSKNDIKDQRIFIIQDFITGKRNDVENLDKKLKYGLFDEWEY